MTSRAPGRTTPGRFDNNALPPRIIVPPSLVIASIVIPSSLVIPAKAGIHGYRDKGLGYAGMDSRSSRE